MKDMKRRNRNWDNDNYIMRQHGKSIRRNIARTFVKAQTSIATYRAIALLQDQMHKRVLEDTPIEEFAKA